MNVRIDTARQHEHARRVQVRRGLELTTDLGDLAAGDPEVGDGAVDQGAAPNRQIYLRHEYDRRV